MGVAAGETGHAAGGSSTNGAVAAQVSETRLVIIFLCNRENSKLMHNKLCMLDCMTLETLKTVWILCFGKGFEVCS